MKTSQANTWMAFHEAWFGQEPVAPLTPGKIRAIGSAFKHGGYRGFANYRTTAKQMHVKAGHSWSDLLDLCMDEAERSVLRGIGPGRQALPIDLPTITRHEPTTSSYGTLASPMVKRMLIVAAMFMLRELELATIRVRHTHFDHERATCSLYLAVSKTDPEARGCFRKWGCLCVDEPGAPCAYHAALEQLEFIRELFEGPLDDIALFPDAAGHPLAKAVVVEAWRMLAADAGLVIEREGRAITGHTARVTGAQFLASIGMCLFLIQLLARWESAIVMQYVKEAPLIALTQTTRLMMQAQPRLMKDTPLSTGSDLESKIKGLIKGWDEKLKEAEDLYHNLKALSTRELHVHEDAGQTIEDMAIDMKDRTAIINTNPASGKTHIALVHGGAHSKEEWITRCKWKYGDLPHEAVSTLVTPRKKCKRCWNIYL